MKTSRERFEARYPAAKNQVFLEEENGAERYYHPWNDWFCIWQDCERQTAERCVEIVEGEALEEPTSSPDDWAYGNAVTDCACAIGKEFGLKP